MNDIRVPLALSILGHAVLLALLVFFVTAVPPLSLPPAPKGIAVTFAPSLPQPEAPPKPAAVELPPLPPAPTPPPPAPLPPLAPLPAVEAPPPLPQQKPLVPRRSVLRRPERPQPHREAVSPAPAEPAQPALPLNAYNRVPAPPAEISPGYRALLGAWLERHKRYPESARERDEEGEAVLRFTVDRNGRVVDPTIVKSSGYPDLDAAVAAMMRGATLPPFPADMPQSSIKVTVPIRFSLAG